jgi:hypothetical protein
VKRHCDYEAHDKQILIPEKKVEVEIFNTFLDTDLMSIKIKKTREIT